MQKKMTLVIVGIAALLLAGCAAKQEQAVVIQEEQSSIVETEMQTQTEEVTEEVFPGLMEVYEDNFPIGVALPNQVLKNVSRYEKSILKHFNSITCENEMKPEAILDKAACQENIVQTYTDPAVHFDVCQPAIAFAQEHGLKLRLHTLVWHSQTPSWFFTEDYTEDGALVSREVMLLRMENYIKKVLGYFSEEYPDLIYAVDVCNEAFDEGDGDENGVRQKKNLWYDTVGDDYYYQAFVFARKYATKDMKLFYNDYGCMWKTDLILQHLQKAQDEGLIDGIGMQAHLSIDDEIQRKFIIAAKKFCDAGYELQITELDIGMEEKTESNLKKQARKYRVLFEELKKMQEEGYPVTGITVWGLNDRLTWRQGKYPLLFDEAMEPKEALEGALLSEKIVAVE